MCVALSVKVGLIYNCDVRRKVSPAVMVVLCLACTRAAYTKAVSVCIARALSQQKPQLPSEEMRRWIHLWQIT